MSATFPFRHFNPPLPNPRGIPYRRQSVILPTNNREYCPLPSILSMRLWEWIDLLTHPVTGSFPNGISPKQMDQLANSQVARSSLEHGIEFRPLWKTANHLGVLLWNEVKAGRIYRLHKACYVGKTHRKLQNQRENETTQVEQTQFKKVPETIGYAHDSSAQGRQRNPPLVASAGIGTGKLVHTSQASRPVFMGEAGEGSRTEMEKLPARTEFRCLTCNKSETDGQNVGLKCKGCSYQTHVKCSYSSGVVPASLLNRSSAAVLNWRCYDCKCCQLCTNRDEAADDLLLCDGCDSGEHMGCQKPPISTIPPAPWYCTVCRQEMSRVVEISPKEPQVDKAASPKSDNNNSTPPVNGDNRSQTGDQRPKSSSSPSKSESVRSDTQSTGSDTCKSVSQSVRVSIFEDTPPLLDGIVDSPLNQSIMKPTPVQNSIPALSPISIEKPKPIKIRLGKRPHSSIWQRSDSLESESQSPKRPNIRSASISSGQVEDKISTMPVLETELPVTGTDAPQTPSQERRESNDESMSSPTAIDGPPSLSCIETADIRGAKFWTVEQTANFFIQMGFCDSAQAFKREEIDGPAVLLLQRQDVLHTLGIRLGPALKTYKLVRFIQNNARPHS